MNTHRDDFWVDVTAQIKTYADLRQGDIILAGGTVLGGFLAEVTRRGAVDGPAKEVRLRAFDGHQESGPIDQPFNNDGRADLVLRRWSELTERPYTVELWHDDMTTDCFRTFVTVPMGNDSSEVREAVRLARAEYLQESGWTEKDARNSDLRPLCVMRGRVYQEDIPGDAYPEAP